MFQQPNQGDKVNIGELTGSLVLIYVHDIRDGIVTPFGEKEAVSVDLHALDGLKGGEVFRNSLIFQGTLIGSLRGAVGGEPVLGRIGQGVAKPGQNAPYILSPFTDADAAVATAYIQRMKPGVQQPGNGHTAPKATPAAPAAATAAAGTTVDFDSLPAEVQELLKQTGAVA